MQPPRPVAFAVLRVPVNQRAAVFTGDPFYHGYVHTYMCIGMDGARVKGGCGERRGARGVLAEHVSAEPIGGRARADVEFE